MRAKILELGLIDYERCFALQKDILARKCSGLEDDYLLFCEHPAVITCGRRADPANILASGDELESRNIPVVKTDRGGDVSLHYPGQLVVYPIFDLTRRKKDLNVFLRALEDAVMDAVSAYGIKPQRVRSLTGVWVEDKKICSIGIGVRKWITYHGLSLNVNDPGVIFELIHPCGLSARRMSSLSRIIEREIDMREAAAHLKESFGKIFGLKFGPLEK